MRKRAKRGDGVEGQSGEESPGTRARSGLRWWVVVVMLVLGVAGWSHLGRDRQRQVEETIRTITQGVQHASASVQDKFAEARSSARNVGLKQQIAARIRGEKTLDAEKVEVHVENESTAILKGLVPDDAAKEKAVALTRDTRGVLQVVDHLAVVPPPRIIVAPPAGAATAAVADRPPLLR